MTSARRGRWRRSAAGGLAAAARASRLIRHLWLRVTSRRVRPSTFADGEEGTEHDEFYHRHRLLRAAANAAAGVGKIPHVGARVGRTRSPRRARRRSRARRAASVATYQRSTRRGARAHTPAMSLSRSMPHDRDVRRREARGRRGSRRARAPPAGCARRRGSTAGRPGSTWKRPGSSTSARPRARPASRPAAVAQRCRARHSAAEALRSWIAPRSAGYAQPAACRRLRRSKPIGSRRPHSRNRGHQRRAPLPIARACSITLAAAAGRRRSPAGRRGRCRAFSQPMRSRVSPR